MLLYGIIRNVPALSYQRSNIEVDEASVNLLPTNTTASLHRLPTYSLIQVSVGWLFSTTVCSLHLSWEENLYVSG